jgi:hypothetical protein
VSFFSELFRIFSAFHSKDTILNIAQDAMKLADGNLRASGRAKFLKRRLLASTTLKNVSVIASSIDAIASRISNRIANAISTALEQSQDA